MGAWSPRSEAMTFGCNVEAGTEDGQKVLPPGTSDGSGSIAQAPGRRTVGKPFEEDTLTVFHAGSWRMKCHVAVGCQ